MSPIVSVIMATYNSTTYLANAVKSILEQSLKELELIIVDDASTENTKETLKPFSIDTRLKAIYLEKNGGPSAARNAGIRISKGDFIAILDSDDIAFPTRLEAQYNFLKNNPDISICYGNVITYGDKESPKIKRYPITNEQFTKMLLKYSPMCHSTAFIKREVFNKIGIYDETLHFAEDLDLWLRAKPYFKFGNCNQILGKYCVRSNSLINKNNRKCEKVTFDVRKKAIKEGLIKPSLSDIAYNSMHIASHYMLPQSV